MKTPMNYTPHLLCLSLFVVFAAMLVVQKTQINKEYITVSFEANDRLNQPGPTERKNREEVRHEGNPVFLKEDLRDEIREGAVQLTRGHSEILEEKDWMDERTTRESKSVIDGKPFLVLAGSYSDNMILLSKQAQYENKGFTAQIIRFDQKKTRHICLGRFEDEKEAAAFAKKARAQLDIRTYVLDKKH